MNDTSGQGDAGGDPLGRPPGYEHVDAADLVRYVPRCLEQLGLKPGCSVEQIQQAYRQRAYLAQMDAAGGEDRMARLNQALADALEYAKTAGPLAESNLTDADRDDPRPSSRSPGPTGWAAPSEPTRGSYRREAQAESEPEQGPGKTKTPMSLPDPPACPVDRTGPRVGPGRAGLHDGEKLLARSETELALCLQVDPARPGKALYIVGGAGKAFAARIAWTTRRCLFESEYTAPVGLLRRKRYHRIRGRFALAAIRSLQTRPDGAVEVHFAPHGPLQGLYPDHKNWVVRLASMPARLRETLQSAIAATRGARCANDLGRVEVTRL
jgi:hypothetical protein